MDWLLAMGYGTIGGAVVEAVVSSDRILAWNAARHQALERQPATPGPALSAYVDPLSDVAAGMTRILLGAVAGLLFHSQVTGAYAAIAVGCSAPTVLRQLGSARLGSAFELQGGPPIPEIGPRTKPVNGPAVESAVESAVELPAAPTTAEELG